jgi:uncharacterized protein YidB (DUF937 family)
MGLLDSVIGALGGGLGGGRGGQADLLQAVIAMLAQGGLSGSGGAQSGGGGLGGMLGGALGGALGGGSGGSSGGGLGGGLGGLVRQFEQAGMGDVVGSWIGTGQNLPISADQLGSVLGPDVLSQLAKQVGMSQGEVGGQLSELLPQLVDKLTPNGNLADVSESGLGDLGSVLERFSKR